MSLNLRVSKLQERILLRCTCALFEIMRRKNPWKNMESIYNFKMQAYLSSEWDNFYHISILL